MGASEMKEPLYVCVYVPEFSAQALLRLRPELAREAVAVLAGEPPLESVHSVNARAVKLGVQHGMTKAELDVFPGLVVLRRCEEEERNARTVLLDAAGLFTPRIEVQRCGVTAFVMVLDMTGTTRIFGPAENSIRSILRALEALQFFACVVASANLQVAVCIAPMARRGPVIVATGREAESLARLPLDVLNLTERQADTLAMWGLRTLGELAALPEADLVVRLGQEGKRLRRLARGEAPHLMVPEEQVFTLDEFVAFDAPVEMMESLLFVLGPMLDQLLLRAQSRSFALASVMLRLGLDGGGEHERTVKPALPVLQREILVKLLHLDLQAHPPSAGVMSLFVHAEPGDRSKVQLGLFAPQLPDALRLDVTLARIAALVGEERLGRARLMDTHRADSFVMERFVVPDRGEKIGPVDRRAVGLRRFRPAVRVKVQREGQMMKHFFFQGKRYAVQEAYGPWRRSGEWWSSGVWAMEEWDVRAAAKMDDVLCCLMSHDLLRHEWQLEALYD